jgi:hypothetical protein
MSANQLALANKIIELYKIESHFFEKKNVINGK